MKTERRWQAKLVERVLLNALVSALLTTLVGVLCLGVSGALADWIFSQAISFTPNSPAANALRDMSTSLGFLASFPLGLIIFGIAAGKSAPGQLFAPLKSLIGRVTLGQIVGIVGAVSAFYAFVAVKAPLVNQSFAIYATLFSLFGAPALWFAAPSPERYPNAPDTR